MNIIQNYKTNKTKKEKYYLNLSKSNMSKEQGYFGKEENQTPSNSPPRSPASSTSSDSTEYTEENDNTRGRFANYNFVVNQGPRVQNHYRNRIGQLDAQIDILDAQVEQLATIARNQERLVPASNPPAPRQFQTILEAFEERDRQEREAVSNNNAARNQNQNVFRPDFVSNINNIHQNPRPSEINNNVTNTGSFAKKTSTLEWRFQWELP